LEIIKLENSNWNWTDVLDGCNFPTSRFPSWKLQQSILPSYISRIFPDQNQISPVALWQSSCKSPSTMAIRAIDYMQLIEKYLSFLALFGIELLV